MQDIIDIRTWCVSLKEAAEFHKPLKQYMDSNGKIDLGNADALTEYNKAIAIKLADLKLNVPKGFLIPTICLRYAYVRIIHEIFGNKPIKILEIGTGASAVLAMLSAKIYKSYVTATEIHLKSLESARENIQNNKLTDYIDIVQSSGGIIKKVIDPSLNFDVLITYPPIYPKSDINKYDNKNLQNKRGFRGTKSEMIGGGGDGFEFTRKLIHEFLETKNIAHLSILFIKKKHMERATNILSKRGIDVNVIKLKAGTRIRYILITGKINYSLKNIS